MNEFEYRELSDAELERQLRELTVRRRLMKNALKAVVTPIFRKHSFTGAFPRFRRIRPTRYDLLMFTFDQTSDCFLIEIGQCSPDWWRGPFSGYVPPQKLYPWLLEKSQRAIIIPAPRLESFADCFQYGDAKTPEDYQRLAESFTPYIEKAIAMFENFEKVRKTEDEF